MNISLESAISLLKSGAEAPKAEEMRIADALGHILARDIVSPIDQPPFDRSPLDGYALRGEDGARAPTELEVIGTLFAGQAARMTVLSGQAVRVMTGAMLPVGADCVLRQEDTDMGERRVKLYKAVNAGDNFVRRGEDFRAGEALLPAGTRFDASAAAVAAAAGLESVWAYRRPAVAVLSTGDELCSAGSELPEGKIYDANLTYVSARLKELGLECPVCRAVGDDAEALRREITAACAAADVVITTGGVSVGQKDLLAEALSSLGAETVFHGVALKPGSPALFSRLNGTPVLALSGNPFAAAATFELLARPLLAAMSGDESLDTGRGEAILDTDFKKTGGVRRFVRAALKDGHVTLPDGHSSGQLRSMVGCNCLAEIPAGQKAQAGDKIRVVIL